MGGRQFLVGVVDMEVVEFSISAVFMVLFIYSLFQYRSRIAVLFSLTCLSIAIFTFGYGLELISSSVKQIEFALDFEITGLVFSTSFWILVALEFYFHKSNPFFLIFLILLIPVTTLFIFMTNSFHHLYYTRLFITDYQNLSTANLNKGPWYYVFITYTYAGLIFSFALIFKKWIEASFSSKTQAFWMLLGSLCPGLAYAIYINDLFPVFYDLTTFGFAMMAFCLFIAIFKYDFLDLFQLERDQIFDVINEGIIVIDNKNRIIDFNRKSRETFQWLNHHSIGKSMMQFAEGTAIANQPTFYFSVEVIRNKKKLSLGFRTTPIIKKNKQIGKILIFQDITEQTIMLDRLNRMAEMDPLSGVYNRRKLMEEAEKEYYRAYRYGTDLSALMIDIDFFKAVNDTYGHLAGDKVITSIAQECKQRLRKSDIIGRYGGEEFLIILTDTDLEKALVVAEDLRIIIEEMVIEFADKRIYVKVSIGASSTSSYPEKMTIYDLINESDKALYMAKESGRNRVCAR
jgi:diguanylate cyclase (GGDEF)-like protein